MGLLEKMGCMQQSSCWSVLQDLIKVFFLLLPVSQQLLLLLTENISPLEQSLCLISSQNLLIFGSAVGCAVSPQASSSAPALQKHFLLLLIDYSLISAGMPHEH